MFELEASAKSKIVDNITEEAKKNWKNWGETEKNGFKERAKRFGLLGRYPSLGRKKGFFQLETEEIKDPFAQKTEEADGDFSDFNVSGGKAAGKKKNFATNLFGTRISGAPNALIMSPVCVAGHLALGIKGNCGRGGPHDPTDIKKAEHGFSLSDKPLNAPGYNEDTFNPHAKKFFK